MGVAGRPMAITRWAVPLHFPYGMRRPLAMPVVRVASRASAESSTDLGLVNSLLVASRLTSSLIASVLFLASSGTLMFCGLRISFSRILCVLPARRQRSGKEEDRTHGVAQRQLRKHGPVEVAV